MTDREVKMKTANILMISVLIAVANSALAIDPATLTSFQPFKQIGENQGVGYAYVYKNRNKAEMAEIFRNPEVAKKEMRISCDALLSQMLETHPGLPNEGCAGLAVGIENDPNFTIEACQDGMFTRENFLGLLSRDGMAFGAWNRVCLADEHVVKYKGIPIVSTMCLNTAGPMTVRPAPAPKPVARTLPPAETFVDVYPAAGTCSWGPRQSRYVAVHMMEPSTAQHQCAVGHMLSQNGMVEVPEGTTPPVLGGPGKPTGKEFSQVCGELVHKEGFAFGTEVHEGVTIFIKDAHSNQKWRIFEGQQSGNRLVSSGLGADLLAAGGLVLRIPDEYDNIDGDVYAIFSDQNKVRTPAPSGVWEKLSSFKRDCDARILTGIDEIGRASCRERVCLAV